MTASFFLLCLVATIALSGAFTPRLGSRISLVRQRMSEEGSQVENDSAPGVSGDFTASDANLFDMNKRVRLGRSRDQDGKSNIWSIEPKMQVVDEEEGQSDFKTNLVVAGLCIGAAVAVLPLFSVFSKLFPDPADF